ncbi:interaptin isoform X5 [Calliphora vicina]|uniref:interaptin isoform X5 n=1 Tax=Calliphora vicina TaxID=7373 RepID=UPI00325A9B95
MESTSEVVSNSVADKSVCAENTKTDQQSVAADVTITIKEHAEEDKKSEVVEMTVAEKKAVEESSSTDEEEVEEIVEEVVVEDCDEAEDGVNQTIKEEVIDSTDGGQTKTTTVVTVEKVTPAGTKTVVTTTSVTKETPTATTTIITTPPTPTTEDVKMQQTEAAVPMKVVSEVKKEESIELEEEVSEEEEEEVEEEEIKKEDNEKIVEATDLNKSEELSQQQLHEDQIVQEAESQPKETTPVKEQSVVDAPSDVPQLNEQENNKQNNLNNTLKDIISSIDSNIKAEENIAALKDRELELLKKQQELAKEIEQQKLLAQKLANENQTQQQINNSFKHQQSNVTSKTYQPISNVSKYSTFEEKQDENVYSRKSETYETTESTNVSKKIDLDKIFTPATDSEEILPKNHYHQYQQQPRPSTSPSILPAYTDAAKHRVQLNLHQEQLLEKYAKPGLKVVQTPWEAALNSGSASAAFVEEQKLSPYPTSTLTPSPTPQLYDASQGGVPVQSTPTESGSYSKPYSTTDYPKYQTYTASVPQAQHEQQQYSGTNSQRELAYKPSIPQGWKAPSMSLPKVEHQSDIDIKRVQQQQHITSVIAAAKSCEEFNTGDEIELIDLIRENVQEEYNNCTTTTTTQVSNHMLSTKEHQFVNHLIKSPELRVSPLPISTQVKYDNAVQELQMKQLQIQQQESNKPAATCDNHHEVVNEKEEKVSVRKQLEQYEDLHRQFSKQIQQEELLKKKREAAKLKALQHNSKKSANNITNISPKSTEQQISQQQQQDDEDDYIKVPVKELITNFEQHCLQEEELNTPSTPATYNLKDNIYLESEQQIKTNEITERHNEDLYMPKEIPLQSYAPPPVAAIPSSVSPFSSNVGYESTQNTTYKPLMTTPMAPYSLPESAPATNKPYGGGSTFPISKPNQHGFASTYGSNQPPKQQYLPPQSYQTRTENTSQNIPQVNFNPSPLPYDKLAKFENQPADEGRYINSPPSINSHLNVRGANKLRNVSPAPFGGSYNSPCTPSSDTHYYGGTPSPVSPSPLSSMQQYSGHNTPNLTHPSVTSTQILNAPSYNTSARGWGCSGGTSTGYQHHPRSHLPASKPQVVNAASMPYTDF